MYKLHSFVNVSYLSIATLIILKHPFCFWLTVFTVFAKVMQKIYCIFSSRDLSSKVWEKIWLKVRGLFKQYLVRTWDDFVSNTHREVKINGWKGPINQYCSKSKARNFVKFWQVFALVLQSTVLDRTLALNKPHIRKLTNMCCLGIKKYMQIFCKLLSVSNEQNVHLKYMYMLTQQIRDLTLPLLFHFFNKKNE